MGYKYLTIHGPISIDIHSYTFDIVLMWRGSPLQEQPIGKVKLVVLASGL